MKLSHNKKFSDMVNANTSESDLAKIEGGEGGDDNSILNSPMSVGMLKLFAKKFA